MSHEPAPAVLGVGIDLSDVGRLDAARRRRPSIDGRIFTASERRTLEGAAPLVVAQVFAAKEAVLKALGKGIDSIALTELDVGGALAAPAPAAVPRGAVGPGGRTAPVVLKGRAAERAELLGVARWLVDLGVLDGPRGPVAVAEVVALSAGAAPSAGARHPR